MIDVKTTIKKLHDAFPMMDADELLKILDCIEEFPEVSSATLHTWNNHSTPLVHTYTAKSISSVLNEQI